MLLEYKLLIVRKHLFKKNNLVKNYFSLKQLSFKGTIIGRALAPYRMAI